MSPSTTASLFTAPKSALSATGTPLTDAERLRETASFTAPDGTRLFVEAEGRGLPVLLCDGIGCSGYVWTPLWDEFPRFVRLIHPHWRGHGDSGPSADPDAASMSVLADDLAFILDRLGIDSVVVVGHSMGVQVALEFARRHPHRVKGLVLVCGAYGRILATFKLPATPLLVAGALALARKIHGPLQTLLRHAMPTEIGWQVAALTEVNAEFLNRDWFMPYLRRMARMDVRYFLRMLQYAHEFDARPWLGDIRVPTLVVAGEKDGFTPPALSAEMARMIPHAAFLPLPAGSHTGSLEHYELFDLALRKYLQDHFGAELRATPFATPLRHG